MRNELAECSTGFYYYGRNAALDAIPPPICAGTYTIRLTSNTSTESPDVLATIEPDKSTNLIAKVYDQNNQLVPNVGVKLALEAKQNSGGHHHPDDTVAARTGTMQGHQELTGNTESHGLPFSYKAPSVSGDYKIVASCTDGKHCTPEGPDTVWVGIKGLEPIIPASDPSSGPLYLLIGETSAHSDNHYLTPLATGRLHQLALLYRQGFPIDPPLYLNDASLERGGLFDLDADWDVPHKEHRRGSVIDIRANGTATAVPQENFKEFQQIVNHLNMTSIFEGNHFHVRLLGMAQ